jgi:PHP family Zn ribbon phosphoesterase
MVKSYDELCSVDNGARFYNTDLHVHSYGASKCVNDNLMTVENIIDEAVKNNISVISITDHNTDAYTGLSGRQIRRHPDTKPETSGRLSIDLILR